VTRAHRFAPAAPDEEIVHGACAPGWDDPGRSDAVTEWLDDLEAAGIERVCCLLSEGQVGQFDGLLDRYRNRFGAERVLHAPITDHELTTPETLAETVLPFLREADAAGEPVVVHCLAGIGRTGQVLAAWLVHARDCEPNDAVTTVRQSGREPAEAVRSGSATRGQLDELLRAVA
jgi:protein-tyrosine phosphatase